MTDRSWQHGNATCKLPPLPLRQRIDESSCKMLGKSMMSSPLPTRPPSGTSSCNTSVSSSRGSSPHSSRTLTSAYTSRSSRTSSISSSASSKSSMSSTARSAARNLRGFSRNLPNDLNLPEPPEAVDATALLSMDELLLDAKGGNGSWKKHRAEEELESRTRLQAEKDFQAQRDREIQRQQNKENDEWVRMTLREQQDIKEKQVAHDRLVELQQEREREELEKALAQREAEEAHRSMLEQPTTCVTCGGDGKCLSCHGSGVLDVTYLSSVVDEAARTFRGKTVCGCLECGGRRDGAELLDSKVFKGRGCCHTCKGSGETRLMAKEVESRMLQYNQQQNAIAACRASIRNSPSP